MANYYVKLSTNIPAPSQDAANELAKRMGEFKDPDGYGVGLSYIDASPSDVGPCVWIAGDESPSIDSILEVIATWQKDFNVTEPAVIEWCFDCSKMRLSAFGGGVAVVYNGEIRTTNTGSVASAIVSGLKGYRSDYIVLNVA
jgi:hypothetical protein